MQKLEDLEISPAELADRLEGGDDLQVLDVRAPHRLASGTVEAEDFFNVKGSDIMGLADPASAGLDPSRPIAVVCGHGHASMTVTQFLRHKGWPAVSLRGGVTAWMSLLRQRVLSQPDGVDEFIQFDRIGKGSLGYLIISGDEALAVDTSRDWPQWREAAREHGADLVGVADTHAHADFISGGPQLAAELDVPYYLNAADAVYPYDGTRGRIEFESVEEGDTISVGRATLHVHQTPGHTEGSVCYRIADDAILTGDFLFIASIGRPDLAGKTDEWAGLLWNSLTRARATWPKQSVIYPAHYSSDAERNSDLSVGREFDDLLETNPALAIEDETAFREFVGGGVKTPPDAYRIIKAINVGLTSVAPEEAEVLEAGKHECALG
ncbi:MAG: MBL fold metallo-hydrolase [Gemmatimonadota bacterium]|jgi:glyoxylase-like metal-dependent hydrolase (beta-lactamase superfamily II)